MAMLMMTMVDCQWLIFETKKEPNRWKISSTIKMILGDKIEAKQNPLIPLFDGTKKKIMQKDKKEFTKKMSWSNERLVLGAIYLCRIL